MARINLLPWREWERERKQQEFLANLGAVVVVAGVMLFVAGFMLDVSEGSQSQRNGFLKTKIATLDAKITEIKDLKQQRQDLLARMRVIQDLQGNRPIIVHVFDELVKTVAKGVHYHGLQMNGAELVVAGTAESNNRISSLMRNLDESSWFNSPNLRSIKEDPKNRVYGDQASTFDLTFSQVNPNAKDQAGEE